MQTTFLYTLSDPETGKIRYLGKSDHPFKRYKKHLRGVEGPVSHKKCWIAGLRAKGLVPYMDLLDEVPETQWKFWEREYIRVFRAIGIPLTNFADGGEGTSLPREKHPMFGKHHTVESRRKIREARSRQGCSEETRDKMSRSQKVRWSEAAREKQSVMQKARRAREAATKDNPI